MTLSHLHNDMQQFMNQVLSQFSTILFCSNQTYHLWMKRCGLLMGYWCSYFSWDFDESIWRLHQVLRTSRYKDWLKSCISQQRHHSIFHQNCPNSRCCNHTSDFRECIYHCRTWSHHHHKSSIPDQLWREEGSSQTKCRLNLQH